jgi:hypothetical protein
MQRRYLIPSASASKIETSDVAAISSGRATEIPPTLALHAAYKFDYEFDPAVGKRVARMAAISSGKATMIAPSLCCILQLTNNT